MGFFQHPRPSSMEGIKSEPKVVQKEPTNLNSNPPAQQIPTVNAPFYRDTLLGGTQPQIPYDALGLDEEDLELLEGDLAAISLDQTIVVKLLGRKIVYGTLQTKINKALKPSESFQLIDIKNDYFLLTFLSRSDYMKALTEGPWMIFGHYLIVEPLTIDFSVHQPFPKKVIAWVRLLGLPPTLYKGSLNIEIVECIGSALKLDYQTECGHRGCFARMAITLHLEKPLVSKTVINGRVQIVEYEALPTVCFKCGTYGHVTRYSKPIN
ncbi:hypothetical protein GQ457_04G017640 [Hibiscus cannabinus]